MPNTSTVPDNLLPRPKVAEQTRRMESIFRPLIMSPMALTAVRKMSPRRMAGQNASQRNPHKTANGEAAPENRNQKRSPILTDNNYRVK